jgi:hypothetical protein
MPAGPETFTIRDSLTACSSWQVSLHAVKRRCRCIQNRVSLENTTLFAFRSFSGHRTGLTKRPLADQVQGGTKSITGTFGREKASRCREALVLVTDSFCEAYLGAGRGGRTPTRLPSADFESDFRHFAGCCITTQ